MNSLKLVRLSDEPVIQGEIVDEPLPSNNQPLMETAPLSGRGLVWLIGWDAGISLAGVVESERSRESRVRDLGAGIDRRRVNFLSRHDFPPKEFDRQPVGSVDNSTRRAGKPSEVRVRMVFTK